MIRRPVDGIRLATLTAIAGTVFIAAGAFWLSFTSLADLAQRSGLSPEQAWAWPLIVDGIIVVATVAAVVLTGSRGVWYPWVLLFAGASVSVVANAIHAILAADSDVPAALAASVAAVPPLVLLAITHLTSILMRRPGPAIDSSSVDEERSLLTATAARHHDAQILRASGLSNRAISRRLGVHPSTVGRWLRTTGSTPPHALEQGGQSNA